MIPVKQEKPLWTSKPRGMHPLPGRQASRVLVGSALACALALGAPATAVPDQVVATVGSRYAPGDISDPTVVVVARGGGLTYMNLDLVEDHSVTSDATDALGNRLFDSPRLRFRQSAPVTGVSSLPAGDYGFHCSIHEGMRGKLRVVPV